MSSKYIVTYSPAPARGNRVEDLNYGGGLRQGREYSHETSQKIRSSEHNRHAAVIKENLLDIICTQNLVRTLRVTVGGAGVSSRFVSRQSTRGC